MGEGENKELKDSWKEMIQKTMDYRFLELVEVGKDWQ